MMTWTIVGLIGLISIGLSIAALVRVQKAISNAATQVGEAALESIDMYGYNT